MSFDLGVFFTSKPATDDEAVHRYVALCQAHDVEVLTEPSPAVVRFLDELTRELPQIDDWTPDTIDDCPWSVAFDASDGHVLMCMTWSAADAAAPRIVALAEKHGLVCVDPQASKILTAPWLRNRKPWWRLW